MIWWVAGIAIFFAVMFFAAVSDWHKEYTANRAPKQDCGCIDGHEWNCRRGGL